MAVLLSDKRYGTGLSALYYIILNYILSQFSKTIQMQDLGVKVKEIFTSFTFSYNLQLQEKEDRSKGKNR